MGFNSGFKGLNNPSLGLLDTEDEGTTLPPQRRQLVTSRPGVKASEDSSLQHFLKLYIPVVLSD